MEFINDKASQADPCLCHFKENTVKNKKNTDSNTNKTKRPFNYAKFWRRAALIAYDTLSVILASFLSLMIRYEFHIGEIPDYFYRPVWEAMPVTIVATLFLFFLFKLYDSLWAFAGETEMQNLVFACIASGVVNILVLHLFRHDYQPVPMSYYFLYIFLLMTLVFVSRFSYRFLRSLKHRSANKDNATNVMLVGAGEAGNIIAREILQSHYSTMNLRCFVDDDTSKWGRYIQGIKVVGGRDQILEARSPRSRGRSSRRSWTSARTRAASCGSCPASTSWSTERSPSPSCVTWRWMTFWAESPCGSTSTPSSAMSGAR